MMAAISPASSSSKRSSRWRPAIAVSAGRRDRSSSTQLPYSAAKVCNGFGSVRLAQRLKTLTHPSLTIVDEIGYVPITRLGAMYFFQLMSRRYEHASTVLTSNKRVRTVGRDPRRRRHGQRADRSPRAPGAARSAGDWGCLGVSVAGGPDPAVLASSGTGLVAARRGAGGPRARGGGRVA